MKCVTSINTIRTCKDINLSQDAMGAMSTLPLPQRGKGSSPYVEKLCHLLNWYNWRNGVPSGMQVFLWSHTLQVLVHPHRHCKFSYIHTANHRRELMGKSTWKGATLKAVSIFQPTGSWGAQHVQSEYIVSWRWRHCVLIQQAQQAGSSAHLADNLSFTQWVKHQSKHTPFTCQPVNCWFIYWRESAMHTV